MLTDIISGMNKARVRDGVPTLADFENLKMKALEGANTEARVQVAEARNRGDVGEAEKQVHWHDLPWMTYDMQGRNRQWTTPYAMWGWS